MARLEAPAVAKLLLELGRRITLTETNPFRARADVRAAESLEALTEPLDRMIAENRLTEAPGIGDAIAAVIAEMHRTGTYPLLEKLRQGVLDMLSPAFVRRKSSFSTRRAALPVSQNWRRPQARID